MINFITGDHLGSTSLVTDSTGAVINQTQYKAWGEERYSSGSKQTNYGYTGQYSYESDFGLHFYNARWYDSSLGRFTQADSIIPAGVQRYDRYAAMENNPVRYVDATGHMVSAGLMGGGCDRLCLNSLGSRDESDAEKDREDDVRIETTIGREDLISDYYFADRHFRTQCFSYCSRQIIYVLVDYQEEAMDLFIDNLTEPYTDKEFARDFVKLALGFTPAGSAISLQDYFADVFNKGTERQTQVAINATMKALSHGYGESQAVAITVMTDLYDDTGATRDVIVATGYDERYTVLTGGWAGGQPAYQLMNLLDKLPLVRYP